MSSRLITTLVTVTTLLTAGMAEAKSKKQSDFEALEKKVEHHLKTFDDLKYMFTYAPDTRIKEHPVKVGQGEWTAVYGIMEGTFSKPMKTADGKTIQPTGKSFKIPMATIGHWTKKGEF